MFSPGSPRSCSHTMTLASMNDSVSIFKDGKLKPGIYMIQNVVSQTYVDMQEHSREVCCRPDTRLEGKGLVGSCLHLTRNHIHGHLQWEILPSGPGYTIRRVRIEPPFSSPCTERGDVARTRQPRQILYHALWVRKRKCCIRCCFSRGLENGDRP